MGANKTPLQKHYDLAGGIQNFTVDFVQGNRQFDWLEISFVHDKSNKDATIYDNYNSERPTVFIQNISK